MTGCDHDHSDVLTGATDEAALTERAVVLFKSGLMSGVTTTLVNAAGASPDQAATFARHSIESMFEDPAMRLSVEETVVRVLKGEHPRPYLLKGAPR